MMTTLRRSGRSVRSVIGCDASPRVQDGADEAEEEPEDDVRGPDPVSQDGAHPDEPDAEHDDDGDTDDGDDDAEDDAAGGDDGRTNGLVVDRRDHRVDRVEG